MSVENETEVRVCVGVCVCVCVCVYYCKHRDVFFTWSYVCLLWILCLESLAKFHSLVEQRKECVSFLVFPRV